jgi:23S rRNA (uracil1939-C5)-methyltransferase
MSSARRHRTAAATLPGEAVVQVETLAHDGRGVAHRDGKAVFLDGALPGEQVRFHYTARHSGYDEGRVSEVVEAAADRVSPRCPHFGGCGGCTLQHLAPDRQLAYKQTWLLDNLARIGRVTPDQWLPPLSGPPWGYRRKARLGVREVLKKGRVLVGFRERSGSRLADLRRCEVLPPPVGDRLEALGDLIGTLSIARRLPQIEVAAGDDATALSFRVLDPPSDADLAKLSAFGQRHQLHIYLQPGRAESTRRLWPAGDAPLVYRLPDEGVELSFLPYHFIQVNADLNRQLVRRALTLLDLHGHEQVLDLYCGLGNFTLPLARQAGTVVGVEGDPALVAQARHNALQNGLNNVQFHTADLNGAIGAQPWRQQTYDRLLLDPPRSGAPTLLPQLVPLQAPKILYISCHPATLARDAGELVHRYGYRLVAAGVMDMFPHTRHVESIALFDR